MCVCLLSSHAVLFGFLFPRDSFHEDIGDEVKVFSFFPSTRFFFVAVVVVVGLANEPTSQRTQRGTPWRDRKGKQVNDDTRAYGSFFYFKNFEIVLPILLPLLLPSYLCVLCVLQTYSTFSIFFDRILVRSLTFLIRLNTTSPKSTL